MKLSQSKRADLLFLASLAMRDYQESVTTGQTPDKVIPMCRYASQVTQ